MATYATYNGPTSANAPPTIPFEPPPRSSLTEGTSIPPPPLQTNTSTEAAEQSGTLLPSNKSFGPLSSHPITPVEGVGNSPFPAMNGDYQAGPSTSRPGTQGDLTLHYSSFPPTQSKLPPEDEYARPYDSVVAGPEPQIFSTRLPPRRDSDEPNSRGRRSSFSSRFARLRSLSNMRSLNSRNGSTNESASNLSQHMMTANPDDSTAADSSTRSRRSSIDGLKRALRGTKRPASPSAESTLNNPEGAMRSNPASGGSQSFPRMMRKRSMDFLSSSTRRMSGMWSRQGPEDDAAMAAEVERERLRDEYNMNVVTSGEGKLMGNSGASMASSLRERMSQEQYRQNRKTSSAPRLMPELPTLFEAHGTLDGEEMFSHIGR